MRLEVVQRVNEALNEYHTNTGIRITYNHISGKFKLAPKKVRKRLEFTYIYHDKGFIKTDNVSVTLKVLLTDVRRYLSAADQKAIWKDGKRAKVQQYT